MSRIFLIITYICSILECSPTIDTSFKEKLFANITLPQQIYIFIRRYNLWIQYVEGAHVRYFCGILECSPTIDTSLEKYLSVVKITFCPYDIHSIAQHGYSLHL